MNFREVGISILSTEGNRTPLQLFREGNRTPLQLFTEESMITEQETTQKSEHLTLSVGTVLSVRNEDEIQTVDIPSTKFQPCSQILTDLQFLVGHLSDSNDMGKDLFKQSICLLGCHLQSGCSECQELR